METLTASGFKDTISFYKFIYSRTQIYRYTVGIDDKSGFKKLKENELGTDSPSVGFWNRMIFKPVCDIPTQRSLSNCEPLDDVKNGTLVCTAGNSVNSRCELLCDQKFGEYSRNHKKTLSCKQRRNGPVWNEEANKCIPAQTVPELKHLTCSGKHPDHLIGEFDCNKANQVRLTACIFDRLYCTCHYYRRKKS